MRFLIVAVALPVLAGCLGLTPPASPGTPTSVAPVPVGSPVGGPVGSPVGGPVDTPGGTTASPLPPTQPTSPPGTEAVPSEPPPASAVHDTIAFVRASTADEVRLIRPDGSDDRSLWAHGVDDPSAVYEIWSLAWSPDSTELALTSTHENWCSINASDAYVISADGQHVRRVTQAPACAELAGFPQGTVRVPIDHSGLLGEGFTGFVYFQGAPSILQVSLPPSGSGEVVFDSVADFGDGVLQLPAMITGAGRDYAVGSAVDVLAGSSVTAFDLGLYEPPATWEVRSPTWRHDGSQLAYAYGFNSLFGIDPHPSPVDFGASLIGEDAGLPNIVIHLAWGPTPETADQLLYQGTDAGVSEGIYLIDVGATDRGEQLLTFESFDLVKGLAWLPDASGFVYSVADNELLDEPQSNVYVYTFADGQATRVTDLTGEFAGLVAVSPDGQTIAFERAAEIDTFGSLTDPEIWIVGRDGSGLRLLAEDAMAPSWSR